MNWKTEAVDKLRKYDAMRQAVLNLPIEIKRLQLEAQSLRSMQLTSAPVKGSGGNREDALLNNLAHRQELQWSLEQAKGWLKITDRALTTLTQEEKLVLHRLYIYPEKGALERLCAELGVENSSIYRKRDKALQRFTLALYGNLADI